METTTMRKTEFIFDGKDGALYDDGDIYVTGKFGGKLYKNGELYIWRAIW